MATGDKLEDVRDIASKTVSQTVKMAHILHISDNPIILNQAENVLMIPDGSGEFTDAMGMLVNKNDIGFGSRSWRYSMLVKDGTIEKMFIEPEVEGDPFEVSDADTMLKYINKDAKIPETATMFSRKGCPHCERAMALLSHHNIYVEQIELDSPVTSRSLRAVSGNSSTPQIFIGGKHIGGADELEKYLS